MSQQINLFNPIFMKQRKHFSLLTMVQALGLIVLGSLAFYGYASWQVKQLGAQSAESTRRYEAEQARLARFSAEFSPQQANQALQEELQRMETLAAEQGELVETLKSGAIGNTTGYSGYMRAFARQVVDGLWLTGFRVVGDASSISLNGGVTAPELLPAYMQRLGREPVMQGKSFTALQMQQPAQDPSAAPAPRYVEFALQSVPGGGEAK